MSSNTVRIGVVQLCSTNKKMENLIQCKNLILEAINQKAQMVFLPEAFDFVASSRQESLDLAEAINGDTISTFQEMAKKYGIYLSLGGFHRKESEVSNKLFNSHIIVGSTGNILAVYDKVHLFDANLPDGTILKESSLIKKGTKLEDIVDTPIGPLGLGICYDMRFPELSMYYREKGAAVLTFPSAFTKKTGEAHWHILLRSRAIETQCYVIAAAQEGEHNEKRTSYGHSLVVDPWGRIIGEFTEPGPGFFVCDIDLQALPKIRSNLPTKLHKRWDLFPCMANQGEPVDIGHKIYKFGPNIQINQSCVFYQSNLSFAFVNISPLVPGHILVCPIRPVSRFESLSSVEVADIYAVVHKIAPKLLRKYDASSLTISQQNGEDAGQSVPHVHVHVLPRKPGDFPENDDIYKQLQSHDKPENKERKYRSEDEMAKEASELKKLFYD